MALNYNLTNVSEETKNDEGRMANLYSVCMWMMGLGMQKLEAEADARKAFARYVTREDAMGYNPDLDMFDIFQWFVGLSTNCTPMTDAAFHKHMQSLRKS